MTSWLAWLEQTAASIWMREEANAYFYALIFHAWGMALLVGGGVVVCLLVLGRGRVLALHRLRPFVVVMGLGGALAVASGLGLLQPACRSPLRRAAWRRWPCWPGGAWWPAASSCSTPTLC